ncbi:hypothetical protein LUZ61_004822 [Rhynchospora tenuis]|uniref:Glycosyltransferase n=1 Tax=Rhynchospora tenuis TaxID=198213 RepID=A0AAD5ZNF5_9POAL|nr:hypothetical protein LUZ61_004822 [Rhynchospora tenuis]
MEGSSAHLALLCSPGMSHLIPFAQLASRLAKVRNIAITLLINSDNPTNPAYLSLLKSFPDGVDAITLPAPPPNSIPDGASPMTQIILTVLSSLPHVQSTLANLLSTKRLSALVIDLFSFPAKEMAGQLGLPCYLFYPSPYTALALNLHAPELVKSYQGMFKDLPEPVKLPGCVPISGPDLVEPLQYRDSEMYHGFLQLCTQLSEMKGILVNTYEELEPGVAESFKEPNEARPPIYAVGPLTRPIESESDQNHESLTWLDSQPDKSVVYVSFGSWGVLNQKQMNELALGLELSGHRFLWVINWSSDTLPEGFIERTKETGYVATSWAPQLAILKHKSIGLFLTHCGWSSVLESITNGVPMVALPLHAEQRLNAALLTDGAKVCLRPKELDCGLVSKDEIARVVKCVMEGEEGEALKQRAGDLKNAAADALLEGGSSYKATVKVIEEWKKTVV